METPASNLNITTQTYDAASNTYAVTINWTPGSTTTLGTTLELQYVDVSPIPDTYTPCGQNGIQCLQVTAFPFNSIIVPGLIPSSYYYYRVNTEFQDAQGNIFWLPVQSFFSVNDVPVSTAPINPLPPFPYALLDQQPLPPFPIVLDSAKVGLPLFPGFAIGPGNSGNAGNAGGNVGNSGQTGNANAGASVNNAIWQATGLSGSSSQRQGDALALVFAVASAESGGDPDACGGCSATPAINPSCGAQAAFCGTYSGHTPCCCSGKYAWWWGLFQLNLDCTAQGAGHTADYLRIPANNANIGVPPIMQQIQAQVGLNTKDYTLLQVAQIATAAGHPGGSFQQSYITDPHSLANNIYNAYQAIKFKMRVTDFPVSDNAVII